MKFGAIIASSVLCLLFTATASSQEKRKVIIDQDCAGPAGTDLQAVLVLLQSPTTDPLGITVISGDEWRDEEVAHVLRLLEIIGRTDIPVVPGAVFPLINNKEEVARWERLYGTVVYQGAWQVEHEHEHEVSHDETEAAHAHHRAVADPFEVPLLPEGNPATAPANEHAASFLVRMVRQYPHEVTIYAGGPLTNLALATALDPKFPELARELVLMGPSINPPTSGYGFSTTTPQRAFNAWWDPEAARMVVRGGWPKITVTTVDVSLKTWLSSPWLNRPDRSPDPSKRLRRFESLTGATLRSSGRWTT